MIILPKEEIKRNVSDDILIQVARTQLESLENGNYLVNSTLAIKLGLTPALCTLYKNLFLEKLQDSSFLDLVEKEIPKFHTKWNEYFKQTLNFTYLKNILTRDRHGLFYTPEKITELAFSQESLSLSTLELLFKIPIFQKLVEKKIPNATNQWVCYLDFLKKDTLSCEQERVLLSTHYFKANGQYVPINSFQIANLLSKKTLSIQSKEGKSITIPPFPVDYFYVEHQINNIKDLFKRKPNSKKDFLKKYPQFYQIDFSFPKVYTNLSTVYRKEEIIFQYLLERDLHGSFIFLEEKKQDASIDLGMKALKNPIFYQHIKNKIPEFDLLWDEFIKRIPSKETLLSEKQREILLAYQEGKWPEKFLNSSKKIKVDQIYLSTQLEKMKKKIEQFNFLKPILLEKNSSLNSIDFIKDYFHYEPLLNHFYLLQYLLKRDSHGTYLSIEEENEKVLEYAKKIEQNLKNPYLNEISKQAIAHFEELWNDFLKNLPQVNPIKPSKKQTEILLSSYVKDESSLFVRERKNEEIAQTISTPLLPVDKVFIEKEREKVKQLFQNHPQALEKFYKRYPQFESYEKGRDLDLNFIQELIIPNKDGFYNSSKVIKGTIYVSSQSYIYQKRKVTEKKLHKKAFRERVEKEIPEIEFLWKSYLDSKKKKEFQEIQKEILKLLYEKLDTGAVVERTNEEIARIISNPSIHYSAYYVEQQKQNIEKLIKENPSLASQLPQWIPFTALSESELKLLQISFQFHQERKRYLNHQEKEIQLGIPMEEYKKIEKSIQWKLQKKEVKRTLSLEYPTLKEEMLIYQQYKVHLYEKLFSEKALSIKRIAMGNENGLNLSLKKKETIEKNVFQEMGANYYKNYFSTCTEKEKWILGLRLGHMDRCVHSISEVASLCDVEEERVRKVTEECLASGEKQISYQYQKMMEKKRR